MSRYTYADITARRTYQGAWACSAMVGGYFVESQYIGYTKREALKMFHEAINRD